MVINLCTFYIALYFYCGYENNNVLFLIFQKKDILIDKMESEVFDVLFAKFLLNFQQYERIHEMPYRRCKVEYFLKLFDHIKCLEKFNCLNECLKICNLDFLANIID